MKLAPSSLGRRVVVIAGPTAVGKSALALRLCEQLPGELISVDSVQVYRGLQIGANKPSNEERRRVVHHLVDVREPDEEYTAGAFYADALRAVDQVLSRGRVPVLVGGTSMYLRWLVGGRPEAPKADPEVAERVRQQLAPLESTGDWATALGALSDLDPERAAKISTNDWYRLGRAMTVAMQTSSTAAELPRPPDVDGLDALRASLDLRCFFLCAPREPLCRRIDARCEAMLGGGLLEETTDLLVAGKLLPSSPAGRAIGYRQVLQYLVRPRWTRQDPSAFRDFVEGFAAASRRYAAQQTKWFRSEAGFEWVEADWDHPEKVEALVRQQLELDRAGFDASLASERQAQLRAVQPDEGKRMRTYMPLLPCLTEHATRKALIARADTCREKIEPALEEVVAADARLAERFPWHSAPLQQAQPQQDDEESQQQMPEVDGDSTATRGSPPVKRPRS